MDYLSPRVQVVLFGQFFVTLDQTINMFFLLDYFGVILNQMIVMIFLEDFCAELNMLLTDGIILKNSFGILLKKKSCIRWFLL
jgi:hypothetical protein